MIRAGMATHRARLERGIDEAVYSIAAQVDELHIYANGYTKLPNDIPRGRNIWWHCGRDFGASAKLGFTAGADVYFGVDDDLIWQPWTMRAALEALERKPDALWSWHGDRLHNPYDNYLNSRTTYPGAKPLEADTRFHIAGSGQCFFRTEAVPIDLYTGRRCVQHDPVLAVWAHRRGIEVWSPGRSEAPARLAKYTHQDAIWGQTRRDPSAVDAVLAEVKLWEVEL